MKNLLTAIMSKLTGSSVNTDVGGRIYLDQAPAGTQTFPYVVFFVVSGYQNDTFKHKIDEFLLQVSIFSASLGITEISGIYDHLKTALDDVSLTVSGETVISFVRDNLTTMVEDVTATGATSSIKHWAVDYIVTVQR